MRNDNHRQRRYLYAARATIVTLTNNIHTLNEEVTTLNGIVSVLANENTVLHGRLESLGNENMDLKESISQILKRLEALERG